LSISRFPPARACLLRRKGRPPKELLDQLDLLREHFRNPTQHPERVYDLDGVQDLLGLCLNAIKQMARSPHWQELP